MGLIRAAVCGWSREVSGKATLRMQTSSWATSATARPDLDGSHEENQGGATGYHQEEQDGSVISH
eukprot:1452596-Pyramimonas_sp.AAC.1